MAQVTFSWEINFKDETEDKSVAGISVGVDKTKDKSLTEKSAEIEETEDESVAETSAEEVDEDIEPEQKAATIKCGDSDEIINLFQDIVGKHIMSGDILDLGFVKIITHINGSFADIENGFNYRAHHCKTDILPGSNMLETIKNTGAKMLGLKASEVHIKMTSNTKTGNIDINVISNDELPQKHTEN
ncbi:MAG: hypothetical protein LBR10_14340 [Prevotellaceae bacterium]|jgi:hypothetical protein|nr:hypothetical protein [Prevotellaceae bacterium]